MSKRDSIIISNWLPIVTEVENEDENDDTVDFFAIGDDRPVAEFIIAYLEYLRYMYTGDSLKLTYLTQGHVFGICGEMLTTTAETMSEDDCSEVLAMYRAKFHDLLTTQDVGYVLSLIPSIGTEYGDLGCHDKAYDYLTETCQFMRTTCNTTIEDFKYSSRLPWSKMSMSTVSNTHYKFTHILSYHVETILRPDSAEYRRYGGRRAVCVYNRLLNRHTTDITDISDFIGLVKA